MPAHPGTSSHDDEYRSHTDLAPRGVAYCSRAFRSSKLWYQRKLERRGLPQVHQRDVHRLPGGHEGPRGEDEGRAVLVDVQRVDSCRPARGSNFAATLCARCRPRQRATVQILPHHVLRGTTVRTVCLLEATAHHSCCRRKLRDPWIKSTER